MKKFAFIFAVIFTSANLFSQNAPQNEQNLKNQINLGYFNVLHLNGDNSFGLGFKHDTKNGAIRIGSGFTYRHDKSDANDGQYNHTQNNIGFTPRIGYEHHLNYNKWQVYYGIDLLTDFYFGKQVVENEDFEEDNSTDKIQSIGIGIGPLIGVKFQINGKLSISTETNFSAMYSHSKRTVENNDGTEDISKSDRIATGINPLGMVSLNIHF